MTTYTYAELVVPTTKAERLETLLALATELDLPVTDWQSDGFANAMLQIDAAADEDIAQLTAAIARGGLLEDATGKWLTILAKSFYGLARRPAVTTLGQAVLTCASNAGPHTFSAGQLWATNGAQRYFNTTTGTLSAGGTLTLEWQAEKAGPGYAIEENTLTRLLTPLPGVTINNPHRGVGLLPWHTRAGTIEETDSQLKRRCRDKWPALGPGATEDAYHLWALSVNDAITRALVQPATPSGGHVTVVLAGGTGAIETTYVDAVAAYLLTKRPACVTTHVASATNLIVNVAGTARVSPGYSTSFWDATHAAVDSFLQTLEIGDTVYLSALIEVLMGIDGAIDVKLTSPTADVVPTAATQVPAVGTVNVLPSES